MSKAYVGVYSDLLSHFSGFEKIAMIGNLSVRITRPEIELAREGVDRFRIWTRTRGRQGDPLDRESLMRFYGVQRVVDIDVDPEAERIWDLSRPVPEDWQGEFGGVLEVGTLEHIVDPLQALKNIDRILSSDGVVIHVSPITLSYRHGYYRFSPELFLDFYTKACEYEIVVSRILAYYLGYRSLLDPLLYWEHDAREDLLSYKEIGLFRTCVRKARRTLVGLARGAFFVLVARKRTGYREGNLLIQERWKPE